MSMSTKCPQFLRFLNLNAIEFLFASLSKFLTVGAEVPFQYFNKIMDLVL